MRPAPIALWLRLVLALALVRPRAVGWAPVRAPIYVSSWAVQVSQGNREVERLARKFGFVNLGPIFPDGQYFHLRHRGVVQQSLTPHWGHRLHLKKNPKVQWFQQQTLQRRVKRSVVVPTDPWFSKQWYMNSEAQPDLSILQAWSQGLSGQGIVVSVLDDGIEKDHPDLWANYDPLASYDFNDYDPDPQPRYTPSKENRRTDAGRYHHRCHRGPVAEPAAAAHPHLQRQLGSRGRRPHGGRPRHPHPRGLPAWCDQASTRFPWAAPPSRAACPGTAKPAPPPSPPPTAAAWPPTPRSPFLTWRDMQHLVVRASKPAHLQAEDWRTNGVGRQVSHHYGYGLLDAGLLVDTARTWLPTQPQRKCAVRVQSRPTPILPLIYIRENVSACAGLHNSIRSLEHVQAQLTLSYSRRGDLEISLTSPMGTRSTLVAIRPLDVSTEGYNNWVFMSTHFWDENPQGVWTLGLENKGYYFNTGTLYRYTLLLYGTAEDMTARPTGPQVTSSACVQRDTEGLCQACDGPAYILGQLCLAYCPPRFFNHTRLVTAGPGHTAAPALRVCSSCHASCYTCRGGSPRDCTSCPPSSTLDQQQGSCMGPTTPDSRPRLRAAACPHHRCPASAMVLSLLAVTLGGPVLCGMSMDLPLYAWLSRARATPTKPQVWLPAGT
ncbi:proprotein convertase subtilisin/kexin type 4 isoform X7 [Homo sapiens]|nr:proprotein convertase subtilisin/kexin type 4 isoform X7 [Homo sapiens]XP_054177258.1 proprotein convertase subtilisin/kexin type 4 isoform X7 [Homo sapiens]|eukprot:XP_011526392.1 proprotein convertase subtilisin/kexin type 4 isoform X6 [Homo sapiens]